MIEKKGKINKKALQIIKEIHERGGAITAYEISRRTGVAYVTVQKYLKALKELKIVSSDETKKTKGKDGKKSKNIRYNVNYKYLHSNRI